ncbi:MULTISPECIES: IclR family transcriptional regulator [Paenarthrobacter]|uniref:IclR family transcriptional regulator n=1 Tax=Paenarthrobacter aromaticivorans TaxID=2849150 RepID=A0ABS6I9Y5_9MICC|nr:IclR family transcriptional regulator [Paenarthrobacter sp. MMS21-TAE1-1]MBU8868520.1 IclR family transcriptional regulator [Paenarthrobacter sp. MMS21-TAE1-1]
MSESRSALALVDEASGDTPNYPIGSVDNALRLIVMFSERKSVRISDASRLLGVARSTAHRMIQMLQYRGFVVQDEDTRAYVPGPQLLRISFAIVQNLDLRTVAQPVMEQIRDELNETVHLTELRGKDVYFLHSIESTRSLRVGSRIGMTLPAYCTSSGKVMLADLSSQELTEVLGTATLPKLTERTINTRKELDADLQLVRETGFATNFGESEPEVHSVAVPIRDGKGRARAALAIAAPPSRLEPSQAEEIARILETGASKIGESLPA